jgi:hypothetical protein
MLATGAGWLPAAGAGMRQEQVPSASIHPPQECAQIPGPGFRGARESNAAEGRTQGLTPGDHAKTNR